MCVCLFARVSVRSITRVMICKGRAAGDTKIIGSLLFFLFMWYPSKLPYSIYELLLARCSVALSRNNIRHPCIRPPHPPLSPSASFSSPSSTPFVLIGDRAQLFCLCLALTIEVQKHLSVEDTFTRMTSALRNLEN